MVWVLFVAVLFCFFSSVNTVTAQADSCNMRLVQRHVFPGHYLLPWTSSISLSGKRLLVDYCRKGIWVYDINTSGLLDSSCVFDRVTNAAQFLNDSIFVYCDWNCLVSVKIPVGSTTFTVIDSITIPAEAWLSELCIENNIAYMHAIVGDAEAVYLADVSDPESLVYLGNTGIAMRSNVEGSFCVDPPYIYMCGTQRAGRPEFPWLVPFVGIFDATDPTDVVHLTTDFYLGTEDLMRHAKALICKDTLLYVSSYDLSVLEVENDRNNANLLYDDIEDDGLGTKNMTFIYDSMLCRSGSSGIRIYNVSIEDTPNRVAYYHGSGRYLASIEKDTLLYLVYTKDDSIGICVFDIDLDSASQCGYEYSPSNFGMNVFPNPSNSNCVITIDNTNSSGDLSIFSIKGNKIKSFSSINTPININVSTNDMSSGLYIARYETKTTTQSKLFVVMK
jgi:hypothetical protein